MLYMTNTKPTNIEKAFINRMDYYKVLKNKLQVHQTKVGLISLKK